MKRTYLIISLLASILLLFACGGGGGGGGDDPTPTDPNTIFDLSQYNSLDEGTLYEFFLTGSDSNGDRWEGPINSSIGAIQNIGGIDYIPLEIKLSLTNITTNAVLSDTMTTYHDLSGDPVYRVSDKTGVICFPVIIHTMPDTVMIGDSGEVTSYACSDSTSMTGNWSVTDAMNGYAYLVIDGVFLDGSGNIALTEADIYKIDSVGNIISISVSIYRVGDNYTLYLSG